MHDMTSVSVIIPVKEINEYARDAVRHVHKFFPACEILLVPDHDSDEELSGARLISSFPIVAPGGKRDLAARVASGEILAFLDDDAYPSDTWLDSALGHFDDDNVAGVGGPGVTPPSNDSRQRSSGWALASALGSGGSAYRFRSGRRRDVDDFPSMNLLVRKSDFLAVGGFDSPYWPGEDTELCRKLISNLGKRIVYEPDAVVYHHRRPVFVAHLRQQARYGLHRGYFARKFAGNSRRIAYALPTIFTIGIVLGPVFALLSGLGMALYIAVMSLYCGALFATGVWVWWHERDLWVVMLTLAAIFSTHIAYGIAYIKGLLSPELSH